MRIIKLLLSIAVIILCNSCRKDVIAPDNALLKTKLWYNSINDATPFRTHEYQYDNSGRLDRINHSGGSPFKTYGYELFEYTMNNELVNKHTYHYCCDSLGWLLSDSTHYGYENGKLILEEIYYPPPNPYQVSFQYQYDNSNLVRKYRYDTQNFEYCIKYDYSDGVCTRETMYSDINLSSVWNYTIHHYDGGFLIRSEKYSSQNQNFQVITYSYNKTGNLIMEESIKTDFTVVAPVEYLCRYEYY